MFRVYFAASRLAFLLISSSLALMMLGRWLGWILNPGDGDLGAGLREWAGLSALVLAIYTLVIARVLAAFDSAQVVPDRVRQALDALAEGLLVLDERETIVLANEAFTQTVGISAAELTGRRVASLPWVTDKPAQDDDYPWRRATDTNRLQSDQLMRYRDGNKVQRIFSINAAPIQAASGRNRGALITLRDVTKLEGNRSELKAMLAMIKESRDEISRKNRELEILATQDALTGCFNRRAFLPKFERAFRHAQESGQPLACLMVDNDHFKNVNDTYGHHVGDEVLRRVGELLRRLHQGADVVCRFGGEEFCIMLPGYPLAQAVAAAERIRQEVAAIRMRPPADLRLSASVGVADLSFGATDPQSLMNQADACLYEAKRRGRNRVVVYDPHIKARAREQPALEAPAKASPPCGELRSAEAHGKLSPQDPAVKSLSSALAFRDADTAEHCRRVADHCVRVARGLLREPEVATLEVAALLHDIGKIGVPDHILLKPGSLSEDEWRLMSLHDQVGVEIVEHLFASPQLLEIIRFHHCYFGGGGRTASCPVGLEIPLAARILAVADSYDAMVAERVYRRGLNHHEAIAELRRCCGQQFDPLVVQRFIETFSTPAGSPLEPGCSQQQWTVDFGKQIERLASALAAQDRRLFQAQAVRLRKLAQARGLGEIAAVAGRIDGRLLSGQESWGELLGDAQQLIRLCRQAQDRLSEPPPAAWGDTPLADTRVADPRVAQTAVADTTVATV